eukprot:162393-Prorocentrum_minimum.AAC.1
MGRKPPGPLRPAGGTRLAQPAGSPVGSPAWSEGPRDPESKTQERGGGGGAGDPARGEALVQVALEKWAERGPPPGLLRATSGEI